MRTGCESYANWFITGRFPLFLHLFWTKMKLVLSAFGERPTVVFLASGLSVEKGTDSLRQKCSFKNYNNQQ
jgi:hypothetical protein